MRALFVFFVSALCLPALAEPARLPGQVGQSLQLAPGDHRLPMGQQETLAFTAEAPGARRVLLGVRVRIDNRKCIGSTNMLKLAINGQPVGLKTPRRQMRLVNKPNRIPWDDPPFVTWYLPQGEWRIAYAPDFEALANSPSYGSEAYRLSLDVSDLIRAGQNALTLTHTGNAAIAKNAKSDLTLVFRGLKLEVCPGPGVLPGAPERPDPSRPFTSGLKRSGTLKTRGSRDGSLRLDAAGHAYALRSRFSYPGADGKLQWCTFSEPPAAGKMTLATPQWRLSRTLKVEPERGRLLVSDAFTNLTDQPVGIRVEHSLKLQDGRCERVSLGGLEDASSDEVNRPDSPYLFLAREGGGVGVVANDGVLRLHSTLFYDDEAQTGGLRDDWFGLPARGQYTMSWAVYATATASVFDLVNLIRRDWDVAFPIEGGYTFFEPDAILAYDDAKLKRYLDTLRINVAMSQGGWVDWKQWRAGTKNVGHGPIVAGDFYAEYRVRLKAACEKLRRLRPGIKCLVYYDVWLAAGEGVARMYADSLYTGAGNRPRMYQPQTEFGFPLAAVTPTLENTFGKETLQKLPPMILDEIGADGLYWDEIAGAFQNQPDFAHPDGYTYVFDGKTGAVKQAVGARELAAQPFKMALMKAFLDRGATLVGNGPPTNPTEQGRRFARFTETDIAHHGSTTQTTWLYTPVSYAGHPTYAQPKVTEKEFLADIKRKVWQANLYLFSSHLFYHLFTHENLATYQYPITVEELDEGVIAGKERIVTLRSGRFGWPGQKWQGELLLFDPEQRVAERRGVQGDRQGYVRLDLPAEWAAVIIRK